MTIMRKGASDLDFDQGSLKFLDVSRDDCYVCALLREEACNRLAHPLGAACQEHSLTISLA